MLLFFSSFFSFFFVPVYLIVYKPLSLSIFIYIYLPINLFICLSISLSIYQFLPSISLLIIYYLPTYWFSFSSLYDPFSSTLFNKSIIVKRFQVSIYCLPITRRNIRGLKTKVLIFYCDFPLIALTCAVPRKGLF